jgi:excisionase family DNA binding protein
MKEIMTPREAAEYLSVHVRTIYRLAKLGEIPGRKVGGSWRFKKDTLDDWLSEKQEPAPRKGLVDDREGVKKSKLTYGITPGP